MTKLIQIKGVFVDVEKVENPKLGRIVGERGGLIFVQQNKKKHSDHHIDYTDNKEDYTEHREYSDHREYHDYICILR